MMTSRLSQVLRLSLAVGMLFSFPGCANFFTRPDESGSVYTPPPEPTPPTIPDLPTPPQPQ